MATTASAAAYTVDDPDLGVWRFVYDDLDRLQKRTDARGVVTTLLYDALSRVVRKTVATPGVAEVAETLFDLRPAGRGTLQHRPVDHARKRRRGDPLRIPFRRPGFSRGRRG